MEKKRKKSPDIRLVIRVLEQKIIAGKDAKHCRSIVGRENIWRRIAPKLQMQWAGLAQMVGDTDTALQVLSHLNRHAPEMEQAWDEHMEILSLLDRQNELLQLRALRKHLTAGNLTVLPPREIPETDMETVTLPFAEHRGEEAAIHCFMSLFSGRENCFARQWADRKKQTQGYVPVRRAINPEDIREHLEGKQTYGIYLLRRDAHVKTAVIDADLVKNLRNRKRSAAETQMIRRDQQYLFQRIRELSRAQGLEPLTEVSGGKGYHFWFFFADPVPAADAKALLCGIRDEIAGDLRVFSLEVFPKQAGLSGKGLGNLVKLPLGIHRLSGRPSYFPDCKDRTREGQLLFLKKLQPAPINKVRFHFPASPAQVLPHPRKNNATDAGSQGPGSALPENSFSPDTASLSPNGQEQKFPELVRLESLCPPLGRVFRMCRQGRELSLREEKVIFQTLGFLANAGALLHYLMAFQSHYNPHMTDYRLSRVRGTPLGCRRIHSLLDYERGFCSFHSADGYPHPLIHLGMGKGRDMPKSEKIENLNAALENLETALGQVRRFIG